MKEAETKETAIEKQWQQANTEMKQLREQSNTDSARIAELQETLEQERKQNNEKLSLLDDAKNQMSNQFKNLAQEILDVKSQKFESDSQKLLTPLREEIENFRNRINDIHTKETSARASLKTQFETQMTELKQSNIKISDEANNLAHALKNDKKMQGDWGEIAWKNCWKIPVCAKAKSISRKNRCAMKTGTRYVPMSLSVCRTANT